MIMFLVVSDLSMRSRSKIQRHALLLCPVEADDNLPSTECEGITMGKSEGVKKSRKISISTKSEFFSKTYLHPSTTKVQDQHSVLGMLASPFLGRSRDGELAGCLRGQDVGLEADHIFQGKKSGRKILFFMTKIDFQKF